MTILFAGPYQSRLRYRASGGMERCLWHLRDELAVRHEVLVVCRDLDDRPDGVEVRCLGPVVASRRTPRQDVGSEYCRRVARLARNFDAVVAFDLPQLYLYSDRPGTCIFFNDHRQWHVYSALPAHTYAFPARWMCDEFVSQTPVHARSCSVVPMGVDTRQFRPLRRMTSRQRPFTILFASVWHSGKGLAAYLDACALLEEQGVTFRALLVGSSRLWDFGDQQQRVFPAEERDRINELVASAQARTDSLHVIGEVDHRRMAFVYRSADVLVAPSQWRECLPLVVIEGMACGTPALAAASGGYTELIKDCETGYLLSRPTASGIASAVTRIVRNGGVDAEMQRAARAAVMKLSWQRAGSKLESILCSAINYPAAERGDDQHA